MFGYVERTEKARERERGTPVRDFGATIYRKHVCVYLWVDIGWGGGRGMYGFVRKGETIKWDDVVTTTVMRM